LISADDNAGGLLLSQRPDRGVHGGSGRQTIVHQNHSATANVGGRAIPAVETLAPRQLLLLTCRDRTDHMLGYAKAFNNLIVEHTHAASRDCTHRQLLVARDAKLADDKHVQGCFKRACHFICDGYAATR
jgi:hypothetical protein